MLIIGLALYSVAVPNQYISTSFNLCRSASKVLSELAETKTLSGAVMECYNSMSDAERAEVGTEAYDARYADLMEREDYQNMRALLAFFLESSDVYDIYLGSYDRKHGALVYITDPSEEDVALPGYWESVEPTEAQKFLNWDGAGRFYYLRLPEAEVMRYCRDNDGSPNVLMCVLLARAIRRMDPESDKTVTCVVAVDHKAQAGNRQNYRMFVDTANVDMPVSHADYDILMACTKARGQLMLQAQPENTLYTMKTRKLSYEKMEQMPLQMCVDAVKKAIGQPRATISVSYADSRSFGPLDDYIREFYLLSEPSVTDVMCEIACVNHCFFLALSPKTASKAFFEAFLAELDALGVPFEVMRSEPFHLCGVRYDGLEGVKL
jgi:hypothetical protein